MEYIENLNLQTDLEALLSDLNLTVINSLRNLTLPELQAKGLAEDQIQILYAKIDHYYDQRFRSEVLCPMLPEPCHQIECEYLELEADLLAKIVEEGFEYFYELALQRRQHLSDTFSLNEINQIEAALVLFLDAYRAGEIILQFEEE